MLQNRVFQLVVFGTGLLVLVVLVGWWTFGGERIPTPEELLRVALSDADVQQREEAAAQLARHQDPLEELRRVFNESDSPQVKAAAAVGLGRLRDWDSVPGLVEALQSASLPLRARAAEAITEITGQDFGFRVGDPEPKQRETIEVIKQNWTVCRKMYLAKQRKREEQTP